MRSASVPTALHVGNSDESELVGQNCRVTEDAIFMLLHLAVLTRFLSQSRHVPKLLRALLCASSAVAVVYHALLGGMRCSRALSVGLHALFEKPHDHIHFLQGAVARQIHSFIATRLIIQNTAQDRTVRLAKLVLWFS